MLEQRHWVVVDSKDNLERAYDADPVFLVFRIPVDAAEFLIRSDFGREVTEVDGDDPNGPRRSVHQVKFFPTTRSELEAELELLSPKS